MSSVYVARLSIYIVSGGLHFRGEWKANLVQPYGGQPGNGRLGFREAKSANKNIPDLGPEAPKLRSGLFWASQDVLGRRLGAYRIGGGHLGVSWKPLGAS